MKTLNECLLAFGCLLTGAALAFTVVKIINPPRTSPTPMVTATCRVERDLWVVTCVDENGYTVRAEDKSIDVAFSACVDQLD